jgi:hypothetical protein
MQVAAVALNNVFGSRHNKKNKKELKDPIIIGD